MPATARPTAKKRLFAALVIFGLPVLVAGGIFLALCHRHAAAPPTGKTGAFNTRMPAPNLKKTVKNKLEIYLDAEKDSLRRLQQLHSDPYARTATARNSLADSASAGFGSLNKHLSWLGATPPVDSNERRVNEHLSRLYAVLHNNSTAASGDVTTPGTTAPPSWPNAPYSSTAALLPEREVDRLQQLEARLHRQDSTPNPQLQQINALLDKVLAIQHPGQPTAAAKETWLSAGHAPVYPVSARAADSDANPMAPADPLPVDSTAGNGFFGLSTDDEAASAISNVLRAVVHADQTVQTGAIVKLRLLQDIFLKGVRIPANSFLFGPCTVANERVTIRLSSIQYNGNVYPIDMKVLDGGDGLDGLYVPGAITRDVIKEGASQGVSSLGLTSFDPSLGAQAAAAGIETAKNLLSRKIRLITATLKSGQLVILQPSQPR